MVCIVEVSGRGGGKVGEGGGFPIAYYHTNCPSLMEPRHTISLSTRPHTTTSTYTSSPIYHYLHLFHLYLPSCLPLPCLMSCSVLPST